MCASFRRLNHRNEQEYNYKLLFVKQNFNWEYKNPAGVWATISLLHEWTGL